MAPLLFASEKQSVFTPIYAKRQEFVKPKDEDIEALMDYVSENLELLAPKEEGVA